MITFNSERFEALARFARLHLESGDIDPLYLVLREMHVEWPTEIGLWHSLLYVAYYNIASSHQAFYHTQILTPYLPTNVATLPTGVERRGLRGGRPLVRHLSSLCAWAEQYGSLKSFLKDGLTRSPSNNWLWLQEQLQKVWGNGRWAAYKTGEILMKVHDFNVAPTDMGNEFSSGPRHGLALFYPAVKGNTPKAIKELDAQGWDLRDRLRQAGVRLGIEQLETILCDFHTMAQGRYYVGHDIDLLQEQLQNAEQKMENPSILEPIWKARFSCFSEKYLGEYGQFRWNGVDERRRRVYRDTGEVLDRD